jgi:hypothetical protein
MPAGYLIVSAVGPGFVMLMRFGCPSTAVAGEISRRMFSASSSDIGPAGRENGERRRDPLADTARIRGIAKRTELGADDADDLASRLRTRARVGLDDEVGGKPHGR